MPTGGNYNPTGKGGFGERRQDINTKGRPKIFDECRKAAQQIYAEIMVDPETKLPIGTRLEHKLREWIDSDKPVLQLEAMRIAYGKWPETIEHEGLVGQPVTLDEWRAMVAERRKQTLDTVQELEPTPDE